MGADGEKQKCGIDPTFIQTENLPLIFGGLYEGHFVFTKTGEHGNRYINKMDFLRYPQVVTEIGRRLAVQFEDQREQIDLVIGPAIVGSILAYAAANYLNLPYTLTYGDTNNIQFHRGFIPEKSRRCLLVDDFVFSGNSLRESIRVIRQHGLEIIGASVIGSRMTDLIDVDLRTLMSMRFIKTEADRCDLCKRNIPINGFVRE